MGFQSERVAHPKMHGLIVPKSNLILLMQCGFLVNPENSDWEPKTWFSWIGYTIDTQTGLIHANEERIQKLSSKLEQICANLQLSNLVHVRLLASIVDQIISLSASCGSMTQIMTRYLHIIINSRRSWNSEVFLSIQGKEELLFWKKKSESFKRRCVLGAPVYSFQISVS